MVGPGSHFGIDTRKFRVVAVRYLILSCVSYACPVGGMSSAFATWGTCVSALVCVLAVPWVALLAPLLH